MIVCTSGLFVGVDAYLHIPKERWLASASADAYKLSDRFRRANRTGQWRVITDDANCRPTRVEILQCFRELIDSVSDGEAGVFYFAGHGRIIESDLVLAPSDYRPVIPEDSGIMLGRLFSIISGRSKPGTKYILVLDCCQDGEPQAFLPRVPANVCLLAACPAAMTTRESAQSGIFATAISRCLDLLAGAGRGADLCSLRMLYHCLAKEVAAAGGNSFSIPLMQGANADDLYLPLTGSAEYPDSAPGPTCCMESAVLNDQDDARALRTTAQKRLAFWFGFHSEDHCSQYVLEDRKSGRVTVVLPSDGVETGSRGLLEFLLQEIGQRFNHLVMTWAGSLARSDLRALARSMGLDYQPISESMCILTLRRPSLYGQFWVSWLADGQTVARLTCYSLDGEEFSLGYLMPTLGALYDRMRWLRTVPELESS